MTSINRIAIIGTISNDPDARVTTAGDPMLRFNVTVDRPSVDGLPSASDTIPVVAWRQLAEKKDAYAKGDLVLIDGRITTRTYEDNEGRRKYSTEIEAKEIRALGAGALMPDRVASSAPAPAKRMPLEKAPVDVVSFDDFDFGEPKSSPGYAAGPKFDADLDEDIPF